MVLELEGQLASPAGWPALYLEKPTEEWPIVFIVNNI